MKQELTTLETKITTDDIPTCICEKSVADKMEKGCLRCAGVLGGGVAPGVGLLGGIGQLGLDVWKAAAIKTATKEAIAEATDAAIEAGMNAVKLKIKELLDMFTGKPGYVDLLPIVKESTYKNGSALVESATNLINESNRIAGTSRMTSFQTTALYKGPYYVGNFGEAGTTAYETTLTSETATLKAAKVGAVEATYGSCQTAIIASIVTIVVIVLIMVIIYLILRYRRKKKMKKKLQYIKLLE
ncbi:hypothetical protein PFAG_06080 [Plasmodium falciparum Santa Lucia]|uniref:Surface antigen n=1 Tax=Plasmodium falciparum Santa Lucia TaxID=478859 RepID=W7FNC0_PLAFA|nr:hypothetical protein PFAG_06080 [Plasmodium falciparum Santa Lucia]